MKTPCPSCGHHNLEGMDRCEECLHSLMQRDLPRPKKNDPLQRVIMTAPVADLLTGADLLVANTTDTVQKIINTLKKKKKDCVLIYQKKKLVGIISQRDLLLRVAGKHKDLSAVKAEQIMTKNVEFVRGEDPIAFAVNKMSMGGFRHLPVLNAEGVPLSIISIKDVLGYLMKRHQAHE
ncbi:MAG TPA: CBS domain-containing protein [Verrucomicrobiae bacterium]|nr:CBS domain-containing protein [Verrucomicrobiae bacterium]